MNMNIKRVLIKPSRIMLIILGILIIVFAPQFLSGYTYNVINVALIYILCVYGASILVGMGGQLSFAFITLMGFGAYYTANLLTGRLGITLDSITVLITAPLAVGLISFVLGLILFRLRKVFFVFGTLGVVQIAAIFFNNNKPLFGGVNGIRGIPTLNIGTFKFDNNTKWFYLLIGFVVVGYIVVERIRNTKLGRSLASIKDNEMAALSLGVNVYMTKVYAFTISGVLCGLAGALFAMQGNFISPDLYTFNQATLIVIMLLMGGMDHTFGAIIGGLIVSILPESFRNLQSFLMLAYGLAIILLMVFMPTGIAGASAKISNYIKKRISTVFGGKKSYSKKVNK